MLTRVAAIPESPPARATQPATGIDRVTRALSLVGAISRTKSVSDAVGMMLEAVEPFGVSTYAASLLANPERVDPRSALLSNMPAEWTELYIAKRQFLYDPVVQEAMRRPGNFFWRDISPGTAGAENEVFRDARQFGLIDGYTVSIRATWPVAALVSLSGRELAWSDLDAGVVALVANTFMSHVLHLRDMALVPTVKSLSAQERRILLLAAGGLSDKEIARELGIHRSTLLTHWARLKEKLGAADRAHAVAVGLWSGQIVP